MLKCGKKLAAKNVCMCVCVFGNEIEHFQLLLSEIINPFLPLPRLICLSPLSQLCPPLRLCLPLPSLPPSLPHCLHFQASRPVGVGFCDGNHGPRRPLCLQRSRKRGRLYEWSRGANFSRAGHHRNHPQSFSGHICLHLHFRHLRF